MSTETSCAHEDDVIECFYICELCRASYSYGETDCFECEGVGCVYLYQAETYEGAVTIMEEK